MSGEDRYQYEVERQREEQEFQEYMAECFELLSQDETYQKWSKEIQMANGETNEC